MLFIPSNLIFCEFVSFRLVMGFSEKHGIPRRMSILSAQEQKSFRYYSAEFFRNGILMATLARTYFVRKILPFERRQGPLGKGLLGEEGKSYTLQLRHFVI
jgi:hypothetical protein